MSVTFNLMWLIWGLIGYFAIGLVFAGFIAFAMGFSVGSFIGNVIKWPYVLWILIFSFRGY